MATATVFQPTLPHGERQLHAGGVRCDLGNFNPRSRTGSDGFIPKRQARSVDFNPRSRTGSDSCGAGVLPSIARFQPTLPHGERRRNPARHKRGAGHFNPRSRTGSDRITRWSQYIAAHFNPRSRTGSDDLPAAQESPSADFNPRSRTGSDIAGVTTPSSPLPFQPTLPHGERR